VGNSADAHQLCGVCGLLQRGHGDDAVGNT
jgi:hypothetical protein